MNRTVLIFKREPAFWLGLFAVAVQFASSFGMDLSTNVQSAVNAVAAGVMGLVVAYMVHDGVLAAVSAFFQAAVALGVGLGLDWSPDKQTVFMALVVGIASAFTRTQVVAPVSLAQYRASRAGQRTAA